MATLFVKNFDNDTKAWLLKQAKVEGFSNLSEFLRVYFKRVRDEEIVSKWKEQQRANIRLQDVIDSNATKEQLRRRLKNYNLCEGCLCIARDTAGGMKPTCTIFGLSLGDLEMPGHRTDNFPRLRECLERFDLT